MKDYIEERVLEVARYIIESKDTIRKTAKVFGVSKSTYIKIWQKDFKNKPCNYKTNSFYLELNKAERHIRGGKATQAKYKAVK